METKMVDAAQSLEGADRDLTIVRTFDAPRDLVYKMFAEAEHALKWMGPRAYPAIHYQQDVRVGGKWRGCLRSIENPEKELWQGGEFKEIDPPHKMVFTFAWDGEPETIVTIILTPEGTKTRMVFHQTPFESAGSRDGHGLGWNSAFDRLADRLAIMGR